MKTYLIFLILPDFERSKGQIEQKTIQLNLTHFNFHLTITVGRTQKSYTDFFTTILKISTCLNKTSKILIFEQNINIFAGKSADISKSAGALALISSSQISGLHLAIPTLMLIIKFQGRDFSYLRIFLGNLFADLKISFLPN